MKILIRILAIAAGIVFSVKTMGQSVEAALMIKKPGNPAVRYRLEKHGERFVSKEALPVDVRCKWEKDGGDDILTVRIKAKEAVCYHFSAALETGINSSYSDFYLPGFWYRGNLRSPENAPSLKLSKSWNFREDRFSTPLTSVYDCGDKKGVAVLRVLDEPEDVQLQLSEGEVILPGKTSVGFLGFDNDAGSAKLTFGFPYEESPKRYVRKLTLTPSITTFDRLEAGEEKELCWRIHHVEADSFGDFVTKMWRYSYDQMRPMPLPHRYTAEEVKKELCNFFRSSYVDKYPLKYNSGISIYVDDCRQVPEMQVGFCGRVLLNAFNEMEYGTMYQEQDLIVMGQSVFDSFLENGFSAGGYIHDFVNFRDGFPADGIHSIRQQSEAVYAVLHYLKFEKRQGRAHPEWERKIRRLLDNLLLLQKKDGHFARKYRDDGSDFDASGGSTPSVTSTLVMAYEYFGDRRYLEAARRTVDYVEENIISRSDYFSSTLDANCEDKEAAIAAVTSAYYMALVTKGKERRRYIGLCRQAAYFAMTWYYTWDVPFAQGQMMGELGFKSRGWGNVSVENNHIDVFAFELPHIVRWLAAETGEERFEKMCDVICSSLCQLLPTTERLCGIAKPGFYPEVVQHTTWDYGRNGKGFYNDVFAPGWTVASLWEMYTPMRTAGFFNNK